MVLCDKAIKEHCWDTVVSGYETTNPIFIMREIHEKYLARRKNFCSTFVDIEKAFDWAPRVVAWWVLRRLDVDKWLVKIVQSTYRNAKKWYWSQYEFQWQFPGQCKIISRLSVMPFIVFLSVGANI